MRPVGDGEVFWHLALRPDTFDRYYGDDLGYAFEFFLRIRPSLHGDSLR